MSMPVGGFRIGDLYEAIAKSKMATSTATSADFKMGGTGPIVLKMVGTDLAFDAMGKLTGGTITGFDVIGFDGQPTGIIRGLTGFTAAAYNNATTGLSAQPMNDAAMRTLLFANAWTASGSFTNDELVGGMLADTLNGGLGNDILVGGKGSDMLSGGPQTGSNYDESFTRDYDTVDYSGETGTNGIVVDMNLVTGQVKDTFGDTDTLKGIEHIVGTAKVDQISGNDTARHEAFTGGAGADTIDGRGGAADEVRYDREKGTGGVVVDLAAGTGKDSFGTTDTLRNIEWARGGLANDSFKGSAADNQFSGLKGNDTLDGGDGNDMARYDHDEAAGQAASTPTKGVLVNLQAGVARDGFGTLDTLVSIENVRGSNQYDRIGGNAAANMLDGMGGDDVVFGRDGNDTLRGSVGNDMLSGDNGNDKLEGGAGADILNGGAGSDTMLGGVGFDVFVMKGPLTTANLGSDTIGDFERGFDKIDLAGIVAVTVGDPDPVTDFEGLLITDLAGGGGVQVTFSLDPTVSFTVKGSGVSEASIAANDFVF